MMQISCLPAAGPSRMPHLPVGPLDFGLCAGKDTVGQASGALGFSDSSGRPQSAVV